MNNSLSIGSIQSSPLYVRESSRYVIKHGTVKHSGSRGLSNGDSGHTDKMSPVNSAARANSEWRLKRHCRNQK